MDHSLARASTVDVLATNLQTTNLAPPTLFVTAPSAATPSPAATAEQFTALLNLLQSTATQRSAQSPSPPLRRDPHIPTAEELERLEAEEMYAALAMEKAKERFQAKPSP